MHQGVTAWGGLRKGAGGASWPALQIGDLRVPSPIVQGGMAVGISLSGLASAVANAGGIGVIATAGIGWDEPDFETNFREANIRALRRHIRIARAQSNGVLGVNIMVALTNYDDLAATAVEEGVDIIFSGAGLPLTLPKFTQGANSPKLAPIVSSGRAADIVCRKWRSHYKRLPDVVVVEGPKAGGHLGFKPEQIDRQEYALGKILPEVLETLAPYEALAGRPIPVIAAGGVYSGADVWSMLRLGAAGCQMGTRFVATEECDASDNFKQSYLAAKKEDIQIIQSPVGLPGRAIANCLTREAAKGSRMPGRCLLNCLKSCTGPKACFCISARLIQARCGDVLEGLVFAGENAWRVNEIVSVPELMDSLAQEYESRELMERASLILEIGREAASPA
ncbi:MAG: nitronate monooxygenase [Desulfovibrionales bacterium]|nr:nitronate monooxygenase [Desulfovibrionales bacterium]